MNRAQQIENVLNKSTHLHYKEGKEWYPKGHEFCKSLSEKFNIELEKVCGICAALSPLKSWPVNKNITRRYLEGKRNIHTRRQVSKCDWILRGNDIEKCLGGLKTISFYHHLLSPADNNYCTIDRHMLWMFNESPSLTPKKYNTLKFEMINYALSKRWMVSELQATTWVTVKDIK